MSSPDIRSKAKSSAYGTVIPKTEKVVLEKNDLRPWEEQPTFKPELPESDLRSKARSSSYGVAVPTKEAPAAPSPSFKPELVTQTSKLSLQWSEKARSSKYGVQAAAASPSAPAPAPSFTPEIKTTTFREKYQSSVVSSKYGQVVPSSKPVERPSTAPSREVTLDGVKSNGHSRERPQTAGSGRKPLTDPLEDRAKDGGFVLDGINVAECMLARQRGAVLKHEPLGSPRALPGAERTRAATANARSSDYGTRSPARGQKPAEKTPEPHLKFDRSTSVLAEPHQPFKERNALTDKVHSHAYGRNSPAKAERAPPPEREPLWAPTLSVRKVELDPVPRSTLNDKVASHSYGTASPEKGERATPVPEPVWVPSSYHGGIPEPEPPGPRSSTYSQARSHYGKDYNPSANASQLDEGSAY